MTTQEVNELVLAKVPEEKKEAFIEAMVGCKAAAGKPVIWPDGGLYTCATMAPKGRYGDIWHGVTDGAVRKEYTRLDRIREKCRACPYLPNCSPYEHCPTEDTHCREVHELLMLFGILGMKASCRYMWHIFHMPAEFFFQRQPGDLQQNEESNRVISEMFEEAFQKLAGVVVGEKADGASENARLRLLSAMEAVGQSLNFNKKFLRL